MSGIKDDLKVIRVAMNAALVAVAKEHGLEKLVATNATFSGGAFTFKVEGLKAGALSKEAQVYNDVRRFTPGLPELGVEVDMITRRGKVVGSNSTGTKVLLRDPAGNDWLFRTKDVVTAYSRGVRASQVRP